MGDGADIPVIRVVAEREVPGLDFSGGSRIPPSTRLKQV